MGGIDYLGRIKKVKPQMEITKKYHAKEAELALCKDLFLLTQAIIPGGNFIILYKSS